MKRRISRVVIAFTLAVLGGWAITSLQAHGGGIDRCGGHNDRKSGGYHVHNWTAYCSCNPKAEQCRTASGASGTPSTPTTLKGTSDETTNLLARIERLESRVDALEQALQNR